MQRSDNLESHCMKQHNDEVRALETDEKPLKPYFVNYKAYLKHFPDVTGRKCYEVDMWWKPGKRISENDANSNLQPQSKN